MINGLTEQLSRGNNLTIDPMTDEGKKILENFIMRVKNDQ